MRFILSAVFMFSSFVVQAQETGVHIACLEAGRAGFVFEDHLSCKDALVLVESKDGREWYSGVDSSGDCTLDIFVDLDSRTALSGQTCQ